MKHKQYKGFSAIEVLIVVAIVGFLLVIVLATVPHLQREFRNGQRKRDVQRVLAALIDYQNISRGRLPGSHLSAIGPRSKLLKPIIETKVLTLAVDDVDAETVQRCNDAGPRPDFDSVAPGFNDPKLGRCYFVSYGDSLGELGKIDWLTGVKCLGETWFPLVEAETGKENSIAVIIALEGGAYHCVDNT